MHGILSTILQAFRFTHKTLAEASYGDTTGKYRSGIQVLCYNDLTDDVGG